MAATTATRAGALKKGSWQGKFIASFRECGMVTEASKACGKNRATVYRERDRNEVFAAAWAEADEWVTEELEQEAKRRALAGSDTLLMFMLKAKRPGVYRESVNVRHGGKVSVEVEEGVNEGINALLGEVDRLGDQLASVAADGAAATAGRS